MWHVSTWILEWVLAGVLTAAVPGIAVGQPLLAGPKVVERDPPETSTLVRIGLDGRLEEPAERVEFAATELLSLSPDEYDGVRILRRERAADLGRGGTKRIKLLLDFQTALAIDDPAQIDAALEAMRPGRPVWGDPTPLEAQVRAMLTPENAARYDVLLGEYRAAWMAQARRAGAMSIDADDTALRASMERESRVAEVRRSYEGSLEERQKRFNALLARLEVTPEQDAKIRAAVVGLVTETNFDPKPRDYLRTLGSVLGALTWKQRGELMEFLKEERRERGEKGLVAAHPQTATLAASALFMGVAYRRKRPKQRS